MINIEELLYRNGLVMRQSDGTTSYIEGSLISNTLVIRNSSGLVTHRIEKSVYGTDLVVRNVKTGLVEQNIRNAIL